MLLPRGLHRCLLWSCTLDSCVWRACNCPGAWNLTLKVEGCAGERAEEQGIYAFCTEALVTAGEWTAVVEYTEQRPELSKALTKREAVLRSTAATFQVCQQWLSSNVSMHGKQPNACDLLLAGM